MSHPLVIGLFDGASAAAEAAMRLRARGVPADRVSIVARTHDEEETVARMADASPGSELEDSLTGSRLGELSGYLIAAAALVVPGVGPIVAAGPLAAGLGEAAGHLLGGIARALEEAGVPAEEAERWERRVEAGAVLVGAHVGAGDVAETRVTLTSSGATDVAVGSWPDP
jgi:hypothetical protein